MSSRNKRHASPHRRPVDLTGLEGITVLGEPVSVLFSLLLRLELGEPDGGMIELSADIPAAEAEALTRAMARVEPAIPGDRRTEGQRDADHFIIVVERVQEVIAAAIHTRGAA